MASKQPVRRKYVRNSSTDAAVLLASSDCVADPSVSPYSLMSKEYGAASVFFPNMRRRLLQKRISTLRESWRQRLRLAVSRDFTDASSVFCMDVDATEQRYLLCGASNGLVSIHDLESPCFSGAMKPTAIGPVKYSHRFHRFMVTRCQWYPRDSSAFVTSSMDKTVAVWDTNRMKLLEQFPFKEAITQVHWSTVPSCGSLIAVANLTSNIELIDPRAGEAIRNLRWKTEAVSSVRWSAEHSYILMTGGRNGNISLWDVRSGKSHLKLLESKSGNAHGAAVGGINCSDDGLHVVTMSIDRVIRVWNAYSMKLVRTIRLQRGQIASTTSNPTINFDVLSSDGLFCACVPIEDDVLILDLSGQRSHSSTNHFQSVRYQLKGHFQTVNACIFRKSTQQLISSSNDRSVLVWSPGMDEVLPDGASEALEKLQQDEWSDED